MNSSKIKLLRERLGYTQLEFAEKTNLSLRTIQRVESGQTTLKGHTLKSVAQGLGLNPVDLVSGTSTMPDLECRSQMRFINLSAFAFILVPFGNIFLPIILWSKFKKSSAVDELGRRIINYQILWSIITAFCLGVSPFLQKSWHLSFPLIVCVLLASLFSNVILIIYTALSINRGRLDVLNAGPRLV